MSARSLIGGSLIFLYLCACYVGVSAEIISPRLEESLAAYRSIKSGSITILKLRSEFFNKNQKTLGYKSYRKTVFSPITRCFQESYFVPHDKTISRANAERSLDANVYSINGYSLWLRKLHENLDFGFVQQVVESDNYVERGVLSYVEGGPFLLAHALKHDRVIRAERPSIGGDGNWFRLKNLGETKGIHLCFNLGDPGKNGYRVNEIIRFGDQWAGRIRRFAYSKYREYNGTFYPSSFVEENYVNGSISSCEVFEVAEARFSQSSEDEIETLIPLGATVQDVSALRTPPQRGSPPGHFFVWRPIQLIGGSIEKLGFEVPRAK